MPGPISDQLNQSSALVFALHPQLFIRRNFKSTAKFKEFYSEYLYIHNLDSSVINIFIYLLYHIHYKLYMDMHIKSHPSVHPLIRLIFLKIHFEVSCIY